MFKTATAVVIVLAAVATPATAPERLNDEINAKIRAEESDHSQIMRTMHYLTDVYGPRLTGSPNYKAAAEWTLEQMTEWGFTNAHLEPWDFGHPGWLNERFSGFIVTPVKDSLVGEVLGWTPSTKGTASGDAIQIVPPANPTAEELAAWIAATEGTVAGKIVLVGKAIVVPVTIDKAPLRRNDDDVRRQYDPSTPPGARGGRRGQPAPSPSQGRVPAREVNRQVDAMLVAGGALVRVNDAGRDHGQIRAFQNSTYDVTKAVPTVILRNEDYGRISRLIADGSPVKLKFTIVNHTYPEGTTSYNAIAEIAGTDKKDEMVMLGGHLDSWHAATGATDNAIGCAVMMEAARILKASGCSRGEQSASRSGAVRKRACWVRRLRRAAFRHVRGPEPEFANSTAISIWTRAPAECRGASVFGPPEAATVLRGALRRSPTWASPVR